MKNIFFVRYQTILKYKKFLTRFLYMKSKTKQDYSLGKLNGETQTSNTIAERDNYGFSFDLLTLLNNKTIYKTILQYLRFVIT